MAKAMLQEAGRTAQIRPSFMVQTYATSERGRTDKETPMNRIASFVTRQALAVFCALTIALSFAATQLPLPSEIVPVVMVFVPTLVALSLTAVTHGWTGVWTFVSKLGQWRVRLKWIIIALALGLVLRMTMSGIAVVLGSISTIQLRPWTPMQLTIFAVMLFIFAIPEELGWRGYALPKLLVRRSPLAAGAIIGVGWGALHLALTLPGMIYAGLPGLPIVLQVAALSLLIAWLYIRSGGSVLLTSLLHAAQSFFVILNEGLTGAQELWLMAVAYCALALVVVVADWSRLAPWPAAETAARTGNTIGQPIATPSGTQVPTGIPLGHEECATPAPREAIRSQEIV